MGEAGGMKRHHPRIDAVAAEEVPGMVEEHLVIVVIVVEKRHLERARIGLEGPWRKGADHEPVGQEGRVGAGRQVIAMAGHRPDVGHVQAHGRQLPMPAHRVQGVVGIGDGGDLAALLDGDRGLAVLRLVVAERLVHHRGVQQGRVEDRMGAQQAPVGQGEMAVGRLDGQDGAGFGRRQAPHGPPGQVEIVAGPEADPAIVAEEVAGPLVDEQ